MAFLKPLDPKAPAAVLDYEMDWSVWLANGESITDATVTADAGISINPGDKATLVSGGMVTFWLGGGVSGTTYNVTVTVVTQSRTDSRTIAVPVAARMLYGVS